MVTRLLELQGLEKSGDRWLAVQMVLYFSTPLTIVLTQGVYLIYGVTALVWMAQGKRSDELGSIFYQSPGYPPFIVTGWIFAFPTILILASLLFSLIRPKAGPTSTHQWMLPVVWGVDAMLLSGYALAFDYAEGWPTYVVYFAAVMGACSVVGFAAAAVRGVRERVARRRERAAEA